MKVQELLKEAKAKGSPTDIVEFTAPHAGESDDAKADAAAAKFAWKFKCMSTCVQRVGPSGGWPEYTFWGPRSQMEKLAKEYNGPDSGESDDEVALSLKKSRRPYNPMSPAEAAAKRKADFQAALEAVYKELNGPRDAEVMQCDVDDTGINIVMGYDFPENRARVSDLKPLIKTFGKVTSSRNEMASRVQPLYDYSFDFENLTPAEVKVIKSVFKPK